jgi:hypothetical protein
MKRGEDAGFQEGDKAPCQSARGILVLSRDDGTAKEVAAARLGEDLITIRNEQLN